MQPIKEVSIRIIDLKLVDKTILFFNNSNTSIDFIPNLRTSSRTIPRIFRFNTRSPRRSPRSQRCPPSTFPYNIFRLRCHLRFKRIFFFFHLFRSHFAESFMNRSDTSLSFTYHFRQFTAEIINNRFTLHSFFTFHFFSLVFQGFFLVFIPLIKLLSDICR